MPKTEIFRAAALARMSSPDQLDQLLHVTTSKSWVALLAIGVILGTAVAWGFEGRLATRAEGKGVAVRTGTLLSVGTLNSGQVVSVAVKEGDRVVKGQVIAMIAQPSLLDKIREAQAELNDAIADRTRQLQVRDAAAKLEQNSLDQQRATYEQQIRTLQQQLKTVGDQIPVNEQLFTKGLITRQQILALHERQDTINNQIAEIRTQMAQLSASRFRLQNSGDQVDINAQSRITDLERNLRLLRDDLELNSRVLSPYSGQVIEIQGQPGSLVGPGSPILTLQPEAEQIEIETFIPSTSAKEIRPGMAAEVIPSSVRPEEYGFIRGRVTSVSEYPSTESALMRLFQNDSLVKTIASGGPVNEAHVELLRDPSTISGFLWSSKKGAPIHLTPATLCSVRVITREQQPVTMVIPYLKTKLGVY